MSYLKNFVRKPSLWALTSGAWLILAAVAKGASAASPSSSGGSGGGTPAYVFAYFVVIMGIGLGMLTVCMPSRRREKAKPDDYQEKKLV